MTTKEETDRKEFISLMVHNSEIFYAKLLLFGEYSVICGSMALSAPFGRFRGELGFINQEKYIDYDFAVASNLQLREYLSNLLHNTSVIDPILNLVAFEKDLQNGLYFESNIPQGYGLGSSGALTAAIYARYGRVPIRNIRYLSNEAIQYLKSVLAKLEAFFHGTSSGFDSLSSYLKFPLLIYPGNEIAITSIPRNKDHGSAGIFLLNTGKPRKTQQLVEEFLHKCRNDEVFGRMISREYIPLNNLCIHAIIKGDVKDFTRHLKILSAFQLHHFTAMIPGDFRDIWEEGIARKKYYLKLCGAGGGGFITGFAKNLQDALDFLAKKNLSTITVYRSNF